MSDHYSDSRMKPRNKPERQVAALSASLPDVTPKQRQWAINACFDKIGYVTKKELWCSQCGMVHDMTSGEFSNATDNGELVCPHCGTKLKLKNSNKCKILERCYFTVLTTCQGVQVCRHFIIEKKAWKTNSNINVDHAPEYSIDEAVQNWVFEDGTECIMARPCMQNPYYYDKWDFERAMSIKRKNMFPSYSAPDKYDINTAFVYPHRRVLPVLRRNGFTMRFNALSPNEVMKLVLTDREAETLIKNRQYALLEYKSKRSYKEFCMPYAHSVRVAIRNKYIVKDASMWYDYLELLSYFHLDTHNAHYVCPANLKHEHDILLRRKHRVVRQRLIEQKRKEIAQWEVLYRKEKERFFGLCFADDNVFVKVIQSVAEMEEEGDKMHHCVFTMDYYKKPYSLILSARSVRDGARIETVEVSLRSFKVVQSHGLQNSYTPYHDEIIKLVEKNMNIIKKTV